MTISNRSDVKQLATQIESLSRDLQTELDTHGELLVTANELIRKANTLVFALGEVFATESKSSQTTTSAIPVVVARQRYNVRDALGRFTKK